MRLFPEISFKAGPGDLKLLCTLSAVILCLGVCDCAHGYRIDASRILALMMEKYGGTGSFTVEQTHAVYRDDRDEPVELREILHYRLPDGFRSEIRSDHMHRIKVVDRGAVLTVVDCRTVNKPESPFDLYKDVLLHRSYDRLCARLAEMGVNREVASVGRFREKICVVIGAEYPDKSAPQLFMEKETLLPMRLLLPGAGVDIIYDDWRKFGEIRYPAVVTIMYDKKPAREMRVERITAGLGAESGLFDVKGLMRACPAVEAAVEPEDMAYIREAVESFGKKIKRGGE